MLTIRKYGELIGAAIRAGYTPLTVRQAIGGDVVMHPFIIRHDVEMSLGRLDAVVEAERACGVRSSLYFRSDTPVFQTAAMRRYQAMGFEIGLHYNHLDLLGGDATAAAGAFTQSLSEMRAQGVCVETVIPHGNPRLVRRGWTWNGDLVERNPTLLTLNGLLDTGAIRTRYPEAVQVTDLGIRWNGVESHSAFLAAVEERRLSGVYLLTHPDYWSRSPLRAATLVAAARAMRGLGLNRVLARLTPLKRMASRIFNLP